MTIHRKFDIIVLHLKNLSGGLHNNYYTNDRGGRVLHGFSCLEVGLAEVVPMKEIHEIILSTVCDLKKTTLYVALSEKMEVCVQDIVQK